MAREDDTLPKRFFEEKLKDSGKVLLRSEFEKMVSDYYKLRRWT
jgi:aldehyde:ferredoxin oxidoreductase